MKNGEGRWRIVAAHFKKNYEMHTILSSNKLGCLPVLIWETIVELKVLLRVVAAETESQTK